MTLMLGGSILLIAGSAVALVMGWINAEETYIWTSIAATAVAGVLLVLAYFRSRATAEPVQRGNDVETRGAEIDPEILKDREERSKQKYARQMARGEEEGSGDETQVLAPDAPPPEGPSAGGPGAAATAATAATVGSPAGGGETTAVVGEGGGGDEGSSGSDGSAETVVAVPKTKKFHRSDCRFASAKGTETLSRADAEGRGFDPCGTCKP